MGAHVGAPERSQPGAGILLGFAVGLAMWAAIGLVVWALFW